MMTNWRGQTKTIFYLYAPGGLTVTVAEEAQPLPHYYGQQMGPLQGASAGNEASSRLLLLNR